MLQPTIYLTHGGGPCFWMEFPEPMGPHAYDSLKTYLSGLLASLPERPRAILMVTAHWEEALPTVSTSAAPPMLYDYYGFPEHTYHLKYPAPGAPELAARVRALLARAGRDSDTDGERGFDHGVFVPMLIIDPSATMPVLMMSLTQDLDAASHLALGAALAPLREEGVLIIGSGSSYHNLRAIFAAGDRGSAEFDAWLNDAVAQPQDEREQRLRNWPAAPHARACHPRPEHLIPLMVAAGAAGEAVGRNVFRDLIGGKVYSCVQFG